MRRTAVPPPAPVRAPRPGGRRPRTAAIVADGLQEIYFKDGGTRADQLRVESAGIDSFDVSF
ncbi:hypothetical protein [Streptomyces nojiriensis]|uniref:hypothetical protein n=1 Tax=Streptomyces nojiriensis TaxID=66374 RepID=UPI001671DC04|nr:hypothetical protein [Streptomyces nojiriensis]